MVVQPTQGSTGRPWSSRDSNPQALGQYTLIHPDSLGHHSTRLHGPSEDRKGFSQQAGGPGSRKAPHARREACLRKPAGTSSSAHMLGHTHVHTHACKPVPVTSFLGDSAQLDNHTSESPREQGEAGEKTVRQAGGPPKRGCRHRGSGRPGRKAGEGKE